MRVLICGDRNWTDVGMIRSVLLALSYRIAVEGNGPLVIIEGEAKGADRIAREQAEYHGIAVERYPADWKRYGRGAGPIRNQQMLDEGKPDLVIAFHDNLDHSKGTRDMVERARKTRIPVCVETHQPAEQATES